MAEFYRKKKKVCQICAGKSFDYKDVAIVSKYITDSNVYKQFDLFEENK